MTMNQSRCAAQRVLLLCSTAPHFLASKLHLELHLSCKFICTYQTLLVLFLFIGNN